MIVHHETTGDPARPTVVLSNSLGTDLALWAPQVAALAERFHVVRYDSRGHGRSPVPAGPYTIEDLGGDVVALLDHLGIERAHVVGISIGGLTGQHLAVAHRDRVDRLVVADTAAKIGEPKTWRERAALVTRDGMSAVASGVVERWLTPEHAAAHPEKVRWLTEMLLATDPTGYAATCEVLATTDLRESIAGITAPTLAIGATGDVPTPPSATRAIAEAVPGGQYREVDAAHISNVEAAEDFTSALLDFLA
ncbi:3-oxoadipate enol-lactonase [Georgenia halophila]|uniref:3-oxoadipate enol-lactonase n=1 Tax=Georgenia halophila TaxID=620889 RepID=A0ABP8L5T8_9MICO